MEFNLIPQKMKNVLSIESTFFIFCGFRLLTYTLITVCMMQIGINMEMEAKSIGLTYNFEEKESDIIEVFASISGLRIVIATSKSMFDNIFLEILFDNYRGYRFLDEGDLIAYWESEKFRSRHHLYEITRGGWLTGEPVLSGVLSVSIAVGIYREWFVKTTNGCMTILSGHEPILREITK